MSIGRVRLPWGLILASSKPDTLKSFTEFMDAQEVVRLYVKEHGIGCEIPQFLKDNLFKAQAKYERDKAEVANG